MSRWFGDDPASYVYPHAIVNLHVEAEALRIMAHSEATPILAGSDVLRDVDPPRAVFHFSADVGLTGKQARIIAHELSHVTAKLLRIPDRTHETDLGRLP